MLEFVPIKTCLDIEVHLKSLEVSIDPNKSTWLVSDLRRKRDYQNFLLKTNDHFFDESVLRASDLWQILLKRNEPYLSVVSNAFAQVLIKNILDRKSEVLGINGTATRSILSYLKILAPLFFHPQGSSVIMEWFNERPESSNRWKPWYLRAKLCVEILIHEYKILLSEWIVPYLLEKYSGQLKWDKKIFIDLGGKISHSEAELIVILSRVTDVVVFYPDTDWADSFQYLLKPYSFLKDHSSNWKPKTSEKINCKQIEKKSPKMFRFSGALAEVKHVVATVRKWIEEGESPSSICVSSPDIEKYWPCLQPFLEKEGIPYQKDEVIRVHSLLEVKTWLSKIRSLGVHPHFEDIQLSYYNQQQDLLRFEIFESLYKKIYYDSDLSRNSQIEKIYYKKVDHQQPMNSDEFLAESLKYWSGKNEEVIVLIATEMYKNTLPQHLLKWSLWVSYLESIASQKEILINKGSFDGIAIESLSSAQSWSFKNYILIGLEDEGLRNLNQTQIDPADVLSLSYLFGFYLENSDQNYFEFQVHRIIETNYMGSIELIVSNTDFKGGLQTISRLWLEYLMREGQLLEFEKISIPERTRWDSLQSRFNEEILINEGDSIFSFERLMIDLGKNEASTYTISKCLLISPSSLERWSQCPFLVAGDQIFKLRSYPKVDLDIDAMTQGKIYHFLFFHLTQSPFCSEISMDKMDSILESFRIENENDFIANEFWSFFKKKYIEAGFRFLKDEKNLRDHFPHLKTIGRECEFSFYFYPNENGFGRFDQSQSLKLPESGAIKISGRIDRIDGDAVGNLVVVDYKSSISSKHSVSNWIKDRNFQLLLYGWAVENNFVEGISGEIAGLYFQSVKGFERKGFQDDEKCSHLFWTGSKNKKNKQNSKDDLFSEFLKYLNEAGCSMKNGIYEPIPLKKENCLNCEYRGLCRAQHLI